MKDRPPAEVEQAERPVPQGPRRLGTCLNGKVIAGLAVLALGLLLVAPRLVPRVAPLLLIAACPLSMAVMMWGMRGSQGTSGECGRPSGSPGAVSSAQTTEEKLAALRSQVSHMTAEQERLRMRLAQFDGDGQEHDDRVEEARRAPKTGGTSRR